MQKAFIIAFACLCLASSIKAQSMADMMMLSAMMGNRGNSGSSSSSSSTPSSSAGGLASLLSGAGTPGASSSSSGSSSNALAGFAGRSGGMPGMSGMSSMFRGMGPAFMAGGAEMSNMMEYYSCGMLRIPPQMCFMMMQQNM